MSLHRASVTKFVVLVAILLTCVQDTTAAKRRGRTGDCGCAPSSQAGGKAPYSLCKCIQFIWVTFPDFYIYYTIQYQDSCDEFLDCNGGYPAWLGDSVLLPNEDCPDCDIARFSHENANKIKLAAPLEQTYHLSANVYKDTTAVFANDLTQMGYIKTPSGKLLVKTFLAKATPKAGGKTVPLAFGVEVKGTTDKPDFAVVASNHENQPYLYEFTVGTVKYVAIVSK
jgi:hypothetical protein